MGVNFNSGIFGKFFYLLNMSKTIKLTESDLVRIVQRVIQEQEEQTVETAFLNALGKMKYGDILNDKLDINDISEYLREFAKILVLELELVENQDYVPYDDSTGEGISDEDFDKGFEKVMNDFSERMMFHYPEIKESFEEMEKREADRVRKLRRDPEALGRYTREKEYYQNYSDSDSDEDEEITELEDSTASEMIFAAANETPMEDFEDMIDWMMDVMRQVEEQLDDIETIEYDGLHLRRTFGPKLEKMWTDRFGEESLY